MLCECFESPIGGNNINVNKFEGNTVGQCTMNYQLRSQAMMKVQGSRTQPSCGLLFHQGTVLVARGYWWCDLVVGHAAF